MWKRPSNNRLAHPIENGSLMEPFFYLRGRAHHDDAVILSILSILSIGAIGRAP